MSKNSLTKHFLEKKTIKELAELLKKVKDLYKSYSEDDVRNSVVLSRMRAKFRLKDLANDMWDSLQNEFYMTANICDNTVWHWQDEVEKFDEYGYLIERKPCGLTDWSKLVTSWYRKEWALGVLKLIKDFNLDNQNPDYVVAFQNDFKKVKNESEYCSALLKWNDLIYWSPWKLSLYDNTFQQPLSSKWDDDFNSDVDSMEADYE